MSETEEHLEPPAPAPEEAAQEDWKDKYLRTLAEMENMRKRMQKEKQDIARFGMENVLSDFLPLIDNFENALRLAEKAGPEVKNWAIGFEMILSQYKEVLHSHGVIAFHAENTPFDPMLHEAVEVVWTQDHPDGMVLQEFAKGYKSGARVLRAARVKVAKHPASQPSEETSPSEQKDQTQEDTHE